MDKLQIDKKLIIDLILIVLLLTGALQQTNENQTKCTNIRALLKPENHPSAEDDFLVL